MADVKTKKNKSISRPNNSNWLDAMSEIAFLMDTLAQQHGVIMSYGLGISESIALDLLPHRKTLTIRTSLA